ncbi:MAG: hypothetical protein ABW277_14420 [Longimicrobiaceae bacterium]
MIGMRDALAAAVLAAAVFWGSHAVSAAGPEALDMRGALREVEASGATLCLAGGNCLSPDAERTLFLFVRASDCAGAKYDAAVLEELYRATPRRRLNVVGVVDGMTVEEARAFAVASEITYPLYLGSRGLERFVRNPRPAVGNRPMKLLVDRDGRVLRRWTSVTMASMLREEALRLREPRAAGEATP